jgi:uncharacterized protein (TIGR00255 family)
MTGFGRAQATKNGIQVTVEVKTLNSRYLDITMRLPQVLQDKELAVKELVQKNLTRGKINLSIYVDRSETGELNKTFSPELLKGYSKMLEQIKTQANISEPITMRDLLSFDDIFIRKEEDEETIKSIWELAKQASGTAIERTNEMRLREGTELRNDLAAQIDVILDVLEKVKIASEKRAPELRRKLKERIQLLVTDENLDKDRLELEVALIIDKMDINEEAVRLQSHLKFFMDALDSDDVVGRRLNFLSQEINRELNTIGSKANDSEIAHHIVLAKEKLEQIREQVQNIE